jgi:hypothetical protein
MGFELGDRVQFVEGRTRRPRRGFIHEIYPVQGWPDEYDVQLLKRNGGAGRITRKFQSELERDDQGECR